MKGCLELLLAQEVEGALQPFPVTVDGLVDADHLEHLDAGAGDTWHALEAAPGKADARKAPHALNLAREIVVQHSLASRRPITSSCSRTAAFPSRYASRAWVMAVTCH